MASQCSDEEVLLSDPSEDGDGGDRTDDVSSSFSAHSVGPYLGVTAVHIQQPYQVTSCLGYQDYEYSHDTEEHFEDADGDEDFKSVQDDLEIRHAEGMSFSRCMD